MPSAERHHKSATTDKSSASRHHPYRPPHARTEHGLQEHRPKAETQDAVRLPFRATPLRKQDIKRHEALFAYYLDVQKHLAIEELSEKEMKGRWKSFVGKWYDFLVSLLLDDPACKNFS